MADHFRDLVSNETNNFVDQCNKWEGINNSEAEIPDDARGEIRSTVGCAQLLIAERFKQFSGLIDNMEFNLGEQPTTTEDLQGFWDLVYIQVEDINKKFDNLEKLRNNEWQEIQVVQAPAPRKIVRKKVPAKKPVDKARILEARRRLAEAKAIAAKTLCVPDEIETEKENVKTFDAPNFFSVSSPVKKPIIKSSTKDLHLTPRKTSPCPKSLLCMNKLSPAIRRALGPIGMPQTQQ